MRDLGRRGWSPDALGFTHEPMPVETCSCGAKLYSVSTSITGVERERASFREAHAICRTTPTTELTQYPGEPDV